MELTEKELQDKINAAVAASEAGLKTKNKDLLNETKAAKALAKKFEGIDVDALPKAAKDLELLQQNKSKEEGDYKKLYEDQQTQHKTDSTASATALSEANATLSKERRSNALTQALVENHVKPELVSSAAQLLDSNIAITDEGVAMAGDKTVSEFVKEWTTNNDVGKNFTTPHNSGGGANGGGGRGNAEAAFFDPNSPSHNMTEQSKIANADPAKYAALKAAAPAKQQNN